MKQLFCIDLKDYDEGDSIFRRPSARAIILKDGKISLVYSKKEAEFTLRTVSLDEAIKTNAEYKSEVYFNEIMIKREKQVLEIIRKMKN